LFKKHRATYANVIWNYSRKYSSFITGNNNLLELDKLSENIKGNVIKSLIVLSKYLGKYEVFKAKLKQHGIKCTNPNGSFNSFLRILNASNSDILEWFKTASAHLRYNEQTLLKFALITGLRKAEAIESFNLIIKLHEENKLNEYYDENLNVLQHFKFKELFIRNTKNTFISFVSRDFINKICSCEALTYPQIRKRLERSKTRMRINELRDYFGTFMLKHGLLEQEVNLLQGRIPIDIFIRHYWSPNLKELRDRTLEATEQLEVTLTFFF
jgi:intergrase/recombinase